jgi:DNA primase
MEVLQLLRGDLPQKGGRPERSERGPERARIERMERMERMERGERPERAQRPERNEGVEREYREAEPRQAVVEPSPALGPVIEKVKEIFPSLNGTLEALLLDEALAEKGRFPISELVQKVDGDSKVKFIVFDGIVTQRLVDAAAKVGVIGIVGHRVGDIRNMPPTMSIGTFRDLGLE